MSFFTGLRRLPPHRAAHHARLSATPLRDRLRAIAAGPPDLTAFLPLVLDQGPTGSCVGHGGAAAAATACAAAKSLEVASSALPFVPSPREIYRTCRSIERVAPSVPLEDGGANIEDVIAVITRFGVRPMASPTPDGRDSDVTPENVNEELSLLDLETDAQTVLLDVEAHPIGGANIVDDVAYALSVGAPVLIAVPGGSDAWQAYSGGAMAPIAGPLDHCVFLHALDRAAGNVASGTNSWGIGWGEIGRFRVSPEFLQQSTGDAFALSVRVP